MRNYVLRLFSNRASIVLAAAAMTVAGCATYPGLLAPAAQPNAATTAGTAFSGPAATVKVDLGVLAPFLHKQRPAGAASQASGPALGKAPAARHVMNSATEYYLSAAKVRLSVSGPGIATPVTATTDFDNAGAIDTGRAPSMPAGTFSVRVPAGKNRIFTLEVLDVQDHVVAYIKGARSITANETASVRFDMVGTAVARTLEYLTADGGQLAGTLATDDMVEDLRAFVTTFTGYSPNKNSYANAQLDDGTPAYASVSPEYFRAKYLATQLRAAGKAFLTGKPNPLPVNVPNTDPGYPYAVLGTEAKYKVQFTVKPPLGGTLPAQCNYQGYLCGPTTQTWPKLGSATTGSLTLPAGTYQFALRQENLDTSLFPATAWTWQQVTVDEASDTSITQERTITVNTPSASIPVLNKAAAQDLMAPSNGPVDYEYVNKAIYNPNDHKIYMVTYHQRVDSATSQSWYSGRVLRVTPGSAPELLCETPELSDTSNTLDSLLLDAADTLYLSTNHAGLYKIPSVSTKAPVLVPVSAYGNIDDPTGTPSADSKAWPSLTQWCSPAAGVLYFTDSNNHSIRKLEDQDGTVKVTTVAGPVPGNTEPWGGLGSRNGAGSAARFDYPGGVAVVGNALYVHDADNFRIRRVALDGTGTTTTLAGGIFGANDGDATHATFMDNNNSPLVPDTAGNLYFVDNSSQLLRKISAADGTTTTLYNLGNVSVMSIAFDSNGALITTYNDNDLNVYRVITIDLTPAQAGS